MINVEKLIEHLAALGLSQEGELYVTGVIRNPPSRAVSSFRGSNIGRFASLKCGFTIDAESRHLEFALVHQLEWDDTIRGVYCQPHPIQPVRPPNTARHPGPVRRADFLVIYDDRVVVYECKPNDELEALRDARPEWYMQDDGGTWHFFPMEVAYRRLGITYRVISERDINGTLISNVSFLYPFLAQPTSAVPTSAREAVVSILRDRSVCSFNSLLEHVEGRPEWLFILIAHQVVFVAIDRDDITLRSTFYIYCSRDAFNMVSTIADVMRTAGSASSLEMPAEIPGASLADLKRTQDRYALIAPHLAAGRAPAKTEATAYRYYHRFRRAVLAGKSGWEAVMSKTSLRGARGPRLPNHVLALLRETFEQFWATPLRSSVTAFFGEVQTAFEQRGVKAPDRKTIARYLVLLTNEKTTRAREGRLGVYRDRQFSMRDQPLHLHGSRLLEVAHIDHKLLRIVLRCSRTGLVLGFAWITLAIDAFTRMPLGYWLSFGDPRAVAVMMVLRDIVRRWGRLPTVIVTDNGSEFHSTLYQTVLARYATHQLSRAPYHSSDGGIIERLFQTLDADVIDRLEGAIDKRRDIRSYDPLTDPHVVATHTLATLCKRIDAWLFGVYPTLMHDELEAAPQLFWELSAQATGMLNLPRIAMDSDFLFHTMPFDVARTTRVVDRSAGVNFRGRHYWNDIFRTPALEGRDVEIRYEPSDLRFVYARIGPVYHRCIARNLARLAQLAGDEQTSALEMRRRNAMVELQRPERAKKTASFHHAMRAAEELSSISEGMDASPSKIDNRPTENPTNSFAEMDLSSVQEANTWDPQRH